MKSGNAHRVAAGNAALGTQTRGFAVARDAGCWRKAALPGSGDRGTLRVACLGT